MVDLLSRSDCVSFHCPVNSETFYMLNAENLKKLKFGAFLINTCSMNLMSSSALLLALKTGHIKAVALDVFERDSSLTLSSSDSVSFGWLIFTLIIF